MTKNLAFVGRKMGRLSITDWEGLKEIASMIRPEGVTFTVLIEAIMVGKACAKSTANRYIKKMSDAFFITKKNDLYFRL